VARVSCRICALPKAPLRLIDIWTQDAKHCTRRAVVSIFSSTLFSWRETLSFGGKLVSSALVCWRVHEEMDRPHTPACAGSRSLQLYDVRVILSKEELRNRCHTRGARGRPASTRLTDNLSPPISLTQSNVCTSRCSRRCATSSNPVCCSGKTAPVDNQYGPLARSDEGECSCQAQEAWPSACDWITVQACSRHGTDRQRVQKKHTNTCPGCDHHWQT
jgi:hypothetical protein